MFAEKESKNPVRRKGFQELEKWSLAGEVFIFRICSIPKQTINYHKKYIFTCLATARSGGGEECSEDMKKSRNPAMKRSVYRRWYLNTHSRWAKSSTSMPAICNHNERIIHFTIVMLIQYQTLWKQRKNYTASILPSSSLHFLIFHCTRHFDENGKNSSNCSPNAFTRTFNFNYWNCQRFDAKVDSVPSNALWCFVFLLASHYRNEWKLVFCRW